ncbi:cytochrome P450 [Kitasatospora sp. NPDC085879]|uniref:cytochrome P450 n=1 Tax=Kitasatospora sp. NPDC085879 TaxID=3154769 RepID=UPI003416DA1F
MNHAAPVSGMAPRAGWKIPIVGHALELAADPLGFMTELRKRGELVRINIGSREVYVANSPGLIHRILVTDGNKYDKGRLFDKSRDALGNGLPSSDGTFHKRQRRLMQPAFHHARLDQYAALMEGLAREEADSWRSGQIVDMKERLHALTLKIVAKSMLSVDADGLFLSEIQSALPIVLRGIALRTILPIDRLEKFPLPESRRFKAAKNSLRSAVDQVIDRYRMGGIDHGDLLSMMLTAQDVRTGESMTNDEVAAEVMTTIIAGTESSALTLSWFFHEISQRADVERRILSEVESVMDGWSISFSSLPYLTYLRRALTETLRLHCPIWIFMRRSKESVDLGGCTLPAGAEILISPYALHRDEAYYSSPLSFDPDRWTGKEMAARSGTFIPFSAGSRQCIGDSFAWAEMTIIAASILSRWRLHRCGRRATKEKVSAMVSPDRLRVKVTRR